MPTFHHSLKFKTKEFCDIIDITDQVEAFTKENKVKNGLVTVFTKHTTTALKINEVEAGFFADFKDFCQKLVPADGDYRHNDLENRCPSTICQVHEECLNGHSHILQMFVGTASETIPLQNGQMQLGTWQRILLIELDSAREREVLIQVLGE